MQGVCQTCVAIVKNITDILALMLLCVDYQEFTQCCKIVFSFYSVSFVVKVGLNFADFFDCFLHFFRFRGGHKGYIANTKDVLSKTSALLALGYEQALALQAVLTK